MKRIAIATLAGVALVLANSVLPLATASERSPTFIEAPTSTSEVYAAPTVERDTYGVTEAPTVSVATGQASVARPSQGGLSVKTCRAALNGYIVCIGG